MLALGKFAPRRPSTEPSVHDQDELYVIVRGSGVLVHGDKCDEFAAGDVMMVPAGTIHNFESMSDDMAVWVIFYGRKGGGAPE
jgi:mannose-6-phosphate isomerase-like protein (cupin superfamily)